MTVLWESPGDMSMIHKRGSPKERFEQLNFTSFFTIYNLKMTLKMQFKFTIKIIETQIVKFTIGMSPGLCQAV